MCYSGSCPSELPSGACGHRPSNGPRPCEYEDMDDYYKAKETLLDEKNDFLLDQWTDKQLDNHPMRFNNGIQI